MERTINYQFTTDDRNDPRIALMKQVVATTNKIARADYRSGFSNSIQLYRVRLMPRGQRAMYARKDYNSSRAYDSYLPFRYASAFDVYIHRDTTSEHMMEREKETGLTSSQLRRVDREEHALVIAKVEMHQRLREAGAYLNDEGNYVSREKRVEDLRNRGLSETLIERLM